MKKNQTTSDHNVPSGQARLTKEELKAELQAHGVSKSGAKAMVELGGAPTVAEAVDAYQRKATDGTARAYMTHLNRLVTGAGPYCKGSCEACLDPANDYRCNCDCPKCVKSRVSIPPLGDVQANKDMLSTALVKDLAAVAQRHAIKKGIIDNRRRAAKDKPAKRADGRGARESAIAAARSLWRELGSHCNVKAATKVKKPHRVPPDRLPLPPYQLIELHYITITGGDDPELDGLIFDHSLRTGARQENLELLACKDLHPLTQMIDLRDKEKITLPMPASADHIARLQAFAIKRGGPQCDPTSPLYVPDSPVFWSKAGRGRFTPMTGRRIDTLALRWQRTLSWANESQATHHILRHTIAAELTSRFGEQYKEKYLRHVENKMNTRYGKCSLPELARALSFLFDFEHPLVHAQDERERETLQRLGMM